MTTCLIKTWKDPIVGEQYGAGVSNRAHLTYHCIMTYYPSLLGLGVVDRRLHLLESS